MQVFITILWQKGPGFCSPAEKILQQRPASSDKWSYRTRAIKYPNSLDWVNSLPIRPTEFKVCFRINCLLGELVVRQQNWQVYFFKRTCEKYVNRDCVKIIILSLYGKFFVSNDPLNCFHTLQIVDHTSKTMRKVWLFPF